MLGMFGRAFLTLQSTPAVPLRLIWLPSLPIHEGGFVLEMQRLGSDLWLSNGAGSRLNIWVFKSARDYCQTVSDCSKGFENDLHKMFQNLLGCYSIFQEILGGSRVFLTLWECFRLFQSVMESTRAPGDSRTIDR